MQGILGINCFFELLNFEHNSTLVCPRLDNRCRSLMVSEITFGFYVPYVVSISWISLEMKNQLLFLDLTKISNIFAMSDASTSVEQNAAST